MPKKTSTTVQWSLRDLYDIFMYEIEPDLMIDAIPLLDEVYKDETPAERAARGERYVKALEEVQRRFTALIELAKHALLKSKKDVLRSAEEKERGGEAQGSENSLL